MYYHYSYVSQSTRNYNELFVFIDAQAVFNLFQNLPFIYS